MKRFSTILVLLTAFVTLNAQLNIVYFTKEKTMDATAGPDPVLAMLQADTRFTVDVITDAGSPAGDVSAYDLVILSEAPSSSDAINTSLKGIDARFLNMKVYAYKAGVWSWGTADDGPSPNIKIKVIDGMETHPIFKDVTIDGGLVTLFNHGSTDAGEPTGTKGNNYVHTLATITGDVQRLAYPEGAIEADAVSIHAVDDPSASIGGTTIPKKYVLLGFNYGAMCADNATNMTEDGFKIVMNSVEWLLSDLLPSTKVTNTLTQNVKAYGVSGHIRIIANEPSQVTIYSIDGKIVKEATIHGSTNIPCKNGLYIVRVADEGITKVFVTK